MTTVPPPNPNPRVVLFGLECQTTRVVLERLAAAGVEIPAVCLPGSPNAGLVRVPAGRRSGALPFVLPAAAARSVTDTAREHGLDVWRVGDLRSDEVHEAVSALQPDMLLVACYNQRIPARLYRSLPDGGLNLHPSLLPDKRGPDPLFWVFHDGDERAGSTIHRLTDRFDAGEIVAQRAIDLPDGISEDDLDRWLSELGAALFLEYLDDRASGARPGLAQDEAVATWAPHPGGSDWLVHTGWSARRAFNFVRGVGGRGHPIRIFSDDWEQRIVEALCWRGESRMSDDLPAGAVAIEFSDGVLIARVD